MNRVRPLSKVNDNRFGGGAAHRDGHSSAATGNDRRRLPIEAAARGEVLLTAGDWGHPVAVNTARGRELSRWHYAGAVAVLAILVWSAM
jgi:hypothetical protein